MLKMGNIDSDRIYVIGASGGGYATLSLFMKSRHKIKKFSAWASISDLESWYFEKQLKREGFMISGGKLTKKFKEDLSPIYTKTKSPLFWSYPDLDRDKASLYIYAGVYDGIQGSVPITHSINFYNKLLNDLKVSDTSLFVTDHEKLYLLEKRKTLGDFGSICERPIFLEKKHKNMKLTIFEGGHEILYQCALEELLTE